MFRMGTMFAVCAMFAVVGCGSGSGSGGSGGADKGGDKTASVVGTWEATMPEVPGLKLVMTYTADGKFTQETVMEGVKADPNVTLDGGKQSGTYKLDGKSLILSAGGKDKTMTAKELTDAKAVIANDKGVELTFTKKK